MQRYEYKVVPAPQKGTKAKGVKTPEGRFATSIEQLLNQIGQDGWEYQRAELLPSEERSGLTGSTTNWRNVLVFRRALAVEEDAQPEAPEQDDTPTPRPVPGPDEILAKPPVAAPAPISEQPQDPPLSLKPSDATLEEVSSEDADKQ
ncbi:DUF4177 domain-containing protein [uncultured Ruegeria sp.]|uniref:DUF4177 domain-containing protein n=1 Tax=uncultured Ruegeria sp. TaxID=259304 RepID=UPI002613379C|nr:DUF4177 domain-containing protein [uncultured Ruegeria sp.]